MPAWNEPTGIALIAVAGVLSGALNAIAGGGSLISFPTLCALGIPPLIANATNATAQWPGSLSGALGHGQQKPEALAIFKKLWPITALGGATGGVLLLASSARVFDVLIPILIGLATVLLLLQPRIRQLAEKHERRLTISQAGVLQFLFSLYGGYFGAGMGILMLACIGMVFEGSLQEMNALKNRLAVLINLTAAVVFVLKGVVAWLPWLVLTLGSIVGAYASATLSKRVPSNVLRWFVIAVGVAMTAWFALRAVRG